MNSIYNAVEIALEALDNQKDCDGNSAMTHSLMLGTMGHTEEEVMTGILRNVVQYSSYTFEDLLNKGVPVGVVNALRLLTHSKDVPYYDYVQHIIDSGNPLALQVKYNELQYKYELSKASPELQEKYGRALEMFRKAIDESTKVDLYHAPEEADTEVAIFACGCFWGVQHQYDKEPGVKRTLAGYTGGDEEFPSYVDVRKHKTHHVEAIIVEYDPKVTNYEQLCKVFFEIHDPAQTDGVGSDLGPQYRSCIFYRNEVQKKTAEGLMQFLRDKGHEVNTLLLPEGKFYIGEAYHQHYYEKTGGEPYCHLRVKKF